MKVNLLLIFVFYVFGVLANAETKEYSVEIPQKLGQEIETFSFFNFGDLESQSFSLVTTNDNLLHGGGQVLGLKHSDYIEGDDLGQTFGISLELLREYENAELSIKVFSDLYSRFSLIENEEGYISLLAENGKTRTENISNDGLRIKLKKNIENNYFLSFEVEVSKDNDTSGVGLYLQKYFHYLAANIGQAFGHTTVEYEIIEHTDKKMVFAGSAGLGKRLQIYKNKNSDLSFSGDIGIKRSNTADLQAVYTNVSIDYNYKKSEFSLYRRLDTKFYDGYGLDYNQGLFSVGGSEIILQLGFSKEKNRFTPDFWDLKDHALNAEIKKSGDIIYKYGIKAKF